MDFWIPFALIGWTIAVIFFFKSREDTSGYNDLVQRHNNLLAENEKLKPELANLKDESDPQTFRLKAELARQRTEAYEAQIAELDAKRRFERAATGEDSRRPLTAQERSAQIVEQFEMALNLGIAQENSYQEAMAKIDKLFPDDAGARNRLKMTLDSVRSGFRGGRR
jgi:hypothetical protein